MDATSNNKPNNECTVCVSKYTKRDRKEIKCTYCEYSACRECCETYVLSQPSAKCMNCKKEWSKKFLRDAYTATFLTTKYKEHMKNIIFEREKSFMPATQPYIELQRARERKMDEINALHAEINELRAKINEKYREYTALREVSNRNGAALNQSRKYVRPCGYIAGGHIADGSTDGRDACRGFMDENNECGICGIKACPKCDVFLSQTTGEEHVCKEADVETAKLLRKDTRPCPKCNVAIYKISGCDQMWCVQCHTAFSWNTGEIENRIHNPHYYEWMAQQAAQNNQTQNEFLREQQEIYNGICENRLTHQMAHRLVTLAAANQIESRDEPDDYNPGNWGDRAAEIIMNGIHMQHVDLYRYRVPAQQEAEEDNRPERMLYMMGEMTEAQFKDIVSQKERKYEKYREYTQIIEMYLTVVLDITRRFIDHAERVHGFVTQDVAESFLNEYAAIQQHANRCLEDVSKAHFSVLKVIADDGRLL